MSKKLEILVPQYDEDESVIVSLLKSIELQQQVDIKNDIGVIIANDGSDVILSDSFLAGFPFDIRYIRCEHKGVSATRNACLDAATADYVMFCDADDMFVNMCGMYIIFREMAGDGFNVMTSVFVEETKDFKTDEKVYINREMDSTFVHGKVYRRSFLINNKIRWNDALIIHEDSYFNCLAQKMATSIKYCQQPFYLWKWRDGSVCRHDPKYILKTYNNMLDSNTALVIELQRRNKKQDAAFYVCMMIYNAYLMMNKKEWLDQENQEYRNNTEKRFQKYYNDFKPLFDSVPEEQRSQLIVGIKNRFFQEGVFFETVTFDDWIKHIEALK